MDFGALLHYAKKKSDAVTRDEAKCYSTKYAPPKKESKESKQLSNNIQKFLKKREVEEQERKREERQKVASLLAMRDEKSKNKIRKMLKVTKSANKSVLEDANDEDNSSLALPGDGDDYGYVSTEANAFYQKYIEKVRDVKEDKDFAPSRPQSLRDLCGTKERVKAAISRERDEVKSHTRQRQSQPSGKSEPTVARSYSTNGKKLYNPEAERREEERLKREEDQKKAKSLKRPQQPPPMDFQQLLRLAEKKQHEPVVFAMPEKKKKEPERLLSAREKREHEERQRLKEERLKRDKEREQRAKEPPTPSPPSTSTTRKENGSRMEPDGRIPKLSKSVPTPTAKATSTGASETKAKPVPETQRRATTHSSSSSSTSSSVAAVHRAGAAPAQATSTKSATTKPLAATTKPQTQTKAGSSSSSSNSSAPSLAKKSAEQSSKSKDPAKSSLSSSSQSSQSTTAPSVDMRARELAFSQGRRPMKPPMVKKRRIYDEEEYDSELDDFIDDGDCEEDISSHIRDIFGYDKRKYRGFDDDDRGMESSFAQMQREEFISKKLGLQEDLEDMRIEAEHKKKKMAKKRTRKIDDDDDDF